MASIRKHGDKWRAEVFKGGVRASKVLRTKREAQEWASRQEYVISAGESSPKPSTSLAEAVGRYEREILPSMEKNWNSRSSHMFAIRTILRDEIAKMSVREITPADLVAWRDRRMATVKPSSAQRYMNALSSILTACHKDWGLIDDNPMRQVRRPPPAQPRNRRPTKAEIDRLEVAGGDVHMSMGRAHLAFMFAIETAMRSHEIATLTKENIDTERRFAHLPRTKNGQPRDVPLSKEAIRILGLLPGCDPVFGFSSGANLSTNWYALKIKAAVPGLNFHDSRHEAITRLSKKLDVLALARMVGHKNINQLMTYYNETAEQLAARLD